MELMFRPFVHYADFYGRSRRSEYWLWALFLFLANMALSIIEYGFIFVSAAATAGSGSNDARGTGAAVAVMGLVTLARLIFGLAVLLPSVAVAVRRMHDINRSGWWIMMPTIVFLTALVLVISLDGAQFVKEMQAMSTSSGSNPREVFAGIMAIVRPTLWVFLPLALAKLVTFVFRVTEGTAGSNRFGADPKGRGGDVSVF